MVVHATHRTRLRQGNARAAVFHELGDYRVFSQFQMGTVPFMG